MEGKFNKLSVQIGKIINYLPNYGIADLTQVKPKNFKIRKSDKSAISPNFSLATKPRNRNYMKDTYSSKMTKNITLTK